jgi:CDP-diacylglycerol--glycerol-3-phosphate 3-phosphatidyltransferase
MKLNWANRITILRILLIVPFVIFMLKVNDDSLEKYQQDLIRYGATFIFFVMAISDAIDGFLARRKNQITQLGTFLDPMADKLLMTSACLLLFSNQGHVDGFRLPGTVVVLIISKDILLLIGFVIVYFITSQIRIVPVFIGKLATTLQLAMVTAILIAPEASIPIKGWIWFLRFLWWSAAATAVAATLIYIRKGIIFVNEFEQQKSGSPPVPRNS